MVINMSELISVIIPTIGSKFIKESILSILNQTHKNFEIIIIDDSSDENINFLIKQIGNKKIRYFKGNKTGISSALNLGIKKSNGSLIARMDDDDISMPNRFEIQVNNLYLNNLDVVGSNIILLNNNKLIKYPSNHDQIKFCINFYCCMAHPTILAKRSFYESNFYNENLIFEEDYDLWKRTVNFYKFGNLQFPLLFYRIHDKQATLRNKNFDKENSINLNNIYNINNEIKKLKINNSDILYNIYLNILRNNNINLNLLLKIKSKKAIIKYLYENYIKKFILCPISK